MEKEILDQLVEKINNGSATDEELSLYNAYMNRLAEGDVDWSDKFAGGSEALKAELWGMINTKIDYKPKVRLVTWKRIAVAASILLCFSIGGYLVYNGSPVKEQLVVNNDNEVKPGGNKATLTLADGRVIELSTAQTGIITGEQITYANGTPVDQAKGSANNTKSLISLHTPRGGIYEITLPDGTQVWLNSETTIKYPEQFNESERIVQLTGEAYFNVKTIFANNGQKVPFRVVSNNQTVEVLGTEFNINAYPEQSSAKTTLVEGKVAINTQHNHLVLKPNEQASTQQNGETRMKSVNAYNYIAWKEGKFSFDGKTLQETLSEIGRWYDLSIIYENGIPEAELTGDAFRNQNINFVFRLLTVAGVDYKLDVQRRKLTIIRK